MKCLSFVLLLVVVLGSHGQVEPGFNSVERVVLIGIDGLVRDKTQRFLFLVFFDLISLFFLFSHWHPPGIVLPRSSSARHNSRTDKFDEHWTLHEEGERSNPSMEIFCYLFLFLFFF
jgi:hypothetical protein